MYSHVHRYRPSFSLSNGPVINCEERGRGLQNLRGGGGGRSSEVLPIRKGGGKF